ncbi:hypothetical protein B0H14DRAFT_3573024 [Mycena olivaceomarginata]|nr:hypothetical protein B0H14DRAFT_3573024 [Mycena olivaceomarginata]
MPRVINCHRAPAASSTGSKKVARIAHQSPPGKPLKTRNHGLFLDCVLIIRPSRPPVPASEGNAAPGIHSDRFTIAPAEYRVTTDIGWSEEELKTFLSLLFSSHKGSCNVNNISAHLLNKTRAQVLDCYNMLCEKGLLDTDDRRPLQRCLTALNNSFICKPKSGPLKHIIHKPSLLSPPRVNHMANSACADGGIGETDPDAERETDYENYSIIRQTATMKKTYTKILGTQMIWMKRCGHECCNRMHKPGPKRQLLDDPGVTAFDGDTTYKSIEGKMNEWELTIFVKIVLRGSADFFEKLFDELQRIKLEMTQKPMSLKRFVKGGNLLVMNSDMDGAQIMGICRSVMKHNDPDYSGIANDTPLEEGSAGVFQSLLETREEVFFPPSRIIRP